MKATLVGGAGGIGSSVAFNLLLGGGFEVVLVDPRAEMVTSHVMDLEQGVSGSVRAGGEADLLDADVVVLSTGAPLTVNSSRMVYLEGSTGVCLSVPVSIGAGGARRIHEWGLKSAQQSGLHDAAAVVRAAAESIGDVTWAR